MNGRRYGISSMLYIYTEILFSHNGEILSFVTVWMELESIMLSEISQKDKHNVLLVVCRI